MIYIKNMYGFDLYCKIFYWQRSVITFFVLLLSFSGYSQGDKKFIRQGNREYEKEKYADSEISYRKAFDKNNTSADAVFNIGNALYRQKKFEDAGKEFESNYEMNDDRQKKSASLYNLGNSFLLSQKIKESIEAYKSSLKLDPENVRAKYNLAYAQDLLKQQQQQQQQQQNKDQNKEKQDNKDQHQDSEQEQQKKKELQQQHQRQQQEQQQQVQEQQISKEDAERILNALANEEKDVQEKVKLAKVKQEKVKTLRNW